MTDANLRALERAAATGAPRAQAAALRARMRRGELSREQVELAAYCGHVAARQVVGPQRIRYTTCRADGIGVPLDLWVRGLSRWGHTVQVLAGLAAARVALQAEEREAGVGWDPKAQGYRYTDNDARQLAPSVDALLRRSRLALDLADAWRSCPCEPCRMTAVSPGPRFLLGCVDSALWALAFLRPGDRVKPRALAEAVGRAVKESAQTTSESTVLEAMQRELIARALGRAS